MIVICDIDETIADNRHRAHFVENVNKDPNFKADWKTFLSPELVALDSPIHGSRKAIQYLSRHGTLVFLTGRNERLRGVTADWIRRHFEIDVNGGHPIGLPKLIMRPDGDYTKASEYKGKWLQYIGATFPGPHLYIDDDKFLWPVAEQYAIVLRAPQCWDHVFPDPGELPTETHWRR